MSSLFLIIFLILLFTGIPMALVLMVVLALVIKFTTNLPLTSIPQQMFSGIDNYLLVAVFFFIMAGNIMSEGAASKRLIRIGNSILGMTKGGLAISGVLACVIFAAISGSSSATIIAIGSIMIPALIKEGYGKHFSLGLLTCSGSLGILIPPSVPLVIWCLVMGLSISKQFIAGFLPGFLIALILIGYSLILSERHGWKGKQEVNWKEIRVAFKEGIWALSLPVVILGGIYSGIFTPTEASAVAVIYSLFIEIFIHRDLKFSNLHAILKQSALMSSSLLLIIAAASGVSWFFSIQQIPTLIADAMIQVINSKWLFLLMVNFTMLILGCFVDLVSAIVILGPIFLPMLEKFNIDPFHFGIIMIINIEIGFLTPPFGLNLFVTCGLTRESFTEVARSVIPYIMLMFGGLIMITYIPWISTFLIQFVK